MDNSVVAWVVIIGLTATLIYSGIRNAPGIGIIAGILVIGGLLAFDDAISMESLGLTRPDNWVSTILLGALAGAVIQMFAVVVLEPLTDRLTTQTHNHNAVESVKSSLVALIQLLIVSWLLAALFEEIIFRGFLLGETRDLLGASAFATAIAVLATSVIFGLAHWYQGRSGALSTGFIAFLLALLFVASGFNLWLPIVAHGVIDTVGLILIAKGGDIALRNRFTPRGLKLS